MCFAESQWGVPQASGTNPPWVTSPPPPTPQSIPRPAPLRTPTDGSGGGSFLAGFLFASLSPPIHYTNKARPLTRSLPSLALSRTHAARTLHTLALYVYLTPSRDVPLQRYLSRSAPAQSSALLRTPSPVPRRVGRIS